MTDAEAELELVNERFRDVYRIVNVCALLALAVASFCVAWSVRVGWTIWATLELLAGVGCLGLLIHSHVVRRRHSGTLTDISGRRWALFQRCEIEDLEDPTKIYICRWRLVQTPQFGVYLHRIDMDDGSRPLHDHPWSFLSIILRGGYTEELDDRIRDWRTGSIHFMRAVGRHSIRKLLRTPTWTLVLVGARQRDWGFWTSQGWVQHKVFIDRYRKRLANDQPPT
jgi:hypothetical protein